MANPIDYWYQKYLKEKLTWEDVDMILDITDQIANDDSMEKKLRAMSQKEYCLEVLNRFNEQRKREGDQH